MSDNYTQFSELLEIHRPEQEAWLARALQSVYLVDGTRIVEMEQLAGQESAEECARFVAEAVIDGQWDDPRWLETGFEASFQEHEGQRALWIRDGDGSGDPYPPAVLVQRFLAHFQISEPWKLTYSISCSKPRIGEFSGGATFVTAQEIECFSADQWLLRKQKKHAAKGGNAPVAVTDR